MQLNISTDYAIRAMLYLALSEQRANATLISEAMCIPVNTCKKNLHLLKKAGLVRPFAGVTGGYVLAKDPQNIRLVDILQAVGEKVDMSRCLEADENCNRNATATCAVHRVYRIAQAALNEAFDTTLDQLASDS